MPRTPAQIAAEKRRDKDMVQIKVRFHKRDIPKLKKAAAPRPIAGWLRTLARDQAKLKEK